LLIASLPRQRSNIAARQFNFGDRMKNVITPNMPSTAYANAAKFRGLKKHNSNPSKKLRQRAKSDSAHPRTASRARDCVSLRNKETIKKARIPLETPVSPPHPASCVTSSSRAKNERDANT